MRISDAFRLVRFMWHRAAEGFCARRLADVGGCRTCLQLGRRRHGLRLLNCRSSLWTPCSSKRERPGPGPGLVLRVKFEFGALPAFAARSSNSAVNKQCDASGLLHFVDCRGPLRGPRVQAKVIGEIQGVLVLSRDMFTHDLVGQQPQGSRWRSAAASPAQGSDGLLCTVRTADAGHPGQGHGDRQQQFVYLAKGAPGVTMRTSKYHLFRRCGALLAWVADLQGPAGSAPQYD